jgi:hypothetical protein
MAAKLVPGGLFVTPGWLRVPVTASVAGVASWQATVKYAKSRLTFADMECAEEWEGAVNVTAPGIVRVSAYSLTGTTRCVPLAWLVFDVRASYGATTVTVLDVIAGSEDGAALVTAGGSQTVTVVRA